MSRHITSLPIANNLKTKLVKNGVESVNDLKNLKPSDLIKDFGISKSEVMEIYETMNIQHSSKITSVYELLQNEERADFISTFSPGFDNIIGGGVPIGKITELCGAAGSGKTQVCMQLCVNVQIPKIFGGKNSKAIFIDTEGSFSSNRVIEIVKSTEILLIEKFNLSNREDLIKNNFSVEKVLENIFYYRCSDHIQLLACFNNVKILIEKEPNIKLIIIDSLAYPFRFVDFRDQNLSTMKTNILNNIMNIAYLLINKHKLAILFTNQMTTRINRDSMLNMSSSNLVPALGETWAHSANLRILLSWRNSMRQASVCKSSYLPDVKCFYKITKRGIEDDFDNFEKSYVDKEVVNEIQNTNFQIKRKKITD